MNDNEIKAAVNATIARDAANAVNTIALEKIKDEARELAVDRRAERRADFAKGEYGSLADLLAAARKM